MCLLHVCAIKRPECIVSGQSHMLSQRRIVVMQRPDDGLSHTRVSAIHSASLCCHILFFVHLQENRSRVVCVCELLL